MKVAVPDMQATRRAASFCAVRDGLPRSWRAEAGSLCDL